MINVNIAELNFSDGGQSSLFYYSVRDIRNDFEDCLHNFGPNDDYVQSLAFVLYVQGNLPDNQWNFVSKPYLSIFELGDMLANKMRGKNKIYKLQSLNGDLIVDVQLVYDGMVYALNVCADGQKMPPKGKAKIMSRDDIARYLGQFRILGVL